MLYVAGTTTDLVDAIYLPAGTHTMRSRLGPVGGAGTVSLRFRGADSFVDALVLANAAPEIEDVDDSLIVAVAGWFELWLDIDTGVGVAEFDPPSVSASSLSATAAAIDSTTVRVTFGAPMVDNQTLRFADAYELRRDSDNVRLNVRRVAPENIAEPSYVDLIVEEQRDLELYNVSIAIFEAA